MKASILVAVAVWSQCIGLSAQQATKLQGGAETSGSCSPIASNNQGSITIRCTGFSDKQNLQILSLLQKLSHRQSDDQEALLMKMNEILETVKATQRLSAPRKLSEELRQQILKSAWGHCQTENVLIAAPSEDSEAQELAVDIKRLLSSGGMHVRLTYEHMNKVPGNLEDFKIVYTGECVASLFGLAAKNSFHVGFEPVNRNREFRPAQDLTRIYVYPR